MVDLAPLRGLRYAREHLTGSVLAPPYDVIHGQQHQALLRRSPYNVVRLTLGEPSHGSRWHERASAALESWQREGVLARDATPRLYGYRQEFRDRDGRPRARTGLLGRVRLVPWGEGIYRHEHTRTGPKEERLRLMRATATQLSPVFGLYDDPEGHIAPHLEPPACPLLDAWVDGVRQVFWPIADPRVVADITQALAGRDVAIADGHHRYETALAYRAERRMGEGEAPEPRPYDYVLAFLASVQDPGLVVLPTHRLVAGVPDFRPERLLAGLRRHFEVQAVGDGASLSQAMAPASADGVVIGLCLGPEDRRLLRLRDRQAAWRAAPSGCRDLAELDAAVLQNLVLAPHLGISPEMLATHEHVSYVIGEEEACGRVESGEAQAAFILQPVSVERVWRLATAGLTMPQKSTYFHPKPLTGLVMSPLDE